MLPDPHHDHGVFLKICDPEMGLKDPPLQKRESPTLRLRTAQGKVK